MLRDMIAKAKTLSARARAALLAFAIVAPILTVGASAYAQALRPGGGGASLAPQLWKLAGGTVSLTNPSWALSAGSVTVDGAVDGDLTLSENGSINLSTDENTQNLTCMLCLKYDDGNGENNIAKATIAFIDHNDVEQIWLQTHKCLALPCTGGNLHQHFSVEASDAAGLKQTRLGVGYGADVVDVTVNQANLVVNRNAGMTNGNISMSGAGLGGNFLHASDFSFYPQSGTNSTVAFRVAESSGNLRLFGIGTSTVFMDDTLDVTGSLYASGNLGVGTTAPANDLVVSRSGSSGTVNGPELVLRQNQTNINATTNSNVGEIYFAGDDVAPAESGFGAKIRGQASAAWNGTANDYPTDLLFFTQADGGATGMLERLRLTSSGDAYVGTSSGDARLTVAASSESPTTNLFTVRNSTDSARYLTVSSTATLATVPFQVADGSAGGPSLSFSNDTNTGIYRIGSDSMGFSAGGLRFQVDSTGAAIIAGSSASPSLKFTTDTNTGLFSAGADILGVSAGGQAVLTVSATSATFQGKLAVPSTITPGGTTGNQTINLPSGSVNVPTAGTSVTVTNSTVLATSLVFAQAMTNDTTCYVKDTEVSAGSFVIRMTGACAAETKVGFIVFN